MQCGRRAATRDHAFVCAPQVDALYLLMDNGAEIDHETSEYKTALIHAAENERIAGRLPVVFTSSFCDFASPCAGISAHA